MLDPNDDMELKQMEEMGLPVMFINCRIDVSIQCLVYNELSANNILRMFSTKI